MGCGVDKKLQDIEKAVGRLTWWARILAAVWALATIIFLCSCSGWTYNGMSGKEIRQMNWKHGVGFMGSMVVHTAGHMLYYEFSGRDWHIDGLSEIVDGPMDDSDAALAGRIGFIAQLIPPWIAKLSGRRSDFWRGYNLGTQFEIISYPIYRNSATGGGDDLKMIDRGSNPWLEWGIYSIAAAGLSIE